MLGVLKRRWKPKRSNVSRHPISDSSETYDKAGRIGSANGRQVHPLYDEKVHPLCGDVDASPPPYPKRASLDSNPSPTQCWGYDDSPPPQCYPLAPNICVEAGRIQFIRKSAESVQDTPPASPVAPRTEGRITVTRGLQTDDKEECCGFENEKKLLDERIRELENALELAQKNEQKDRLIINKLQKQLSKRESAHRDADRERRMRMDTESRAKQAFQEASRYKSRLKILTTEFARMEETVRSMLVYKKQAEQLRQEKTALTLAFENRSQQYQSTITRLNQEIQTLRRELDQISLDGTSESLLEAHAAALQRHAEENRKQYERCLDDVANQVVRALLAQKNLREEVGSLNAKILELEAQNRALTSMLVYHLQEETNADKLHAKPIVIRDHSSSDTSPINLQTSLNIKHYNSFNSEVLDSPGKCELDSLSNEKRLSTASIIETKLSFQDKKRHQVLTKLWTELKGSEVTPKKLLEALSAVDSALWVPPQRPVSLNLHLPIFPTNKYRRAQPIIAQSSSKSEEDTGNESPESGNRDEGYSTMSSDVQADVTRSSTEGAAVRGLEDLKEVIDETELGESRLLIADSKDPDILYIPLNLLNLKSRNSFPPSNNMLPFQHIMRSFSDSHLYIKITTAPTPLYTFSSPISSSSSIFLVDLTNRAKNNLRRAKGTNALYGNPNADVGDETSQISWSSTIDEKLDTTWDSEYIQHWLRLDETRSVLQQQHRDLLELEYDHTELEDWSLSLSNDDLRENWRKMEVTTPGQISVSTLPSIQENNTLELEEDSNEYLWNNSSYMTDKDGREIINILEHSSHSATQWPYAVTAIINPQLSPDNSWSSGGSDCHSYEPETCSKRSSAVLSGCSDDTGELPAIGTDFTRDFYRLVKFESTKSLASTSSRSMGGALSENGDRETQLQSVLTFIAEQQKFVNMKETRDCNSMPPLTEVTKDITIEEYHSAEIVNDLKSCDNTTFSKITDEENYVSFRQLCQEQAFNEQNLKEQQNENKFDIKQNITYAHEICLVTPLDIEGEACSNINEQPVEICSAVEIETITSSNNSSMEEIEDDINSSSNTVVNKLINESIDSDLTKLSDMTSSDISLTNGGSESLTSSISTPDTIVSKIPRRKLTSSKLPVSPSKINHSSSDSKIPKSKIPHKKSPSKGFKLNAEKQKIVLVEQKAQNVITSENLPQCKSGVISNIIDGPPHRAVSFHERATSKDVIDELNRMIKNGEEVQDQVETVVPSNLDQSCKSTGWVHVERDIDLTDPKARANLLDVMLASVSSDSSPTSSCGGSVASDTTEDHPDYGHLHRIHRCHRQKKANAIRPELAVVRASQPITRPTIIGRPDFFVRYGEKEREAVASFDFLDNLSSTSSSLCCSLEENIETDDKNASCRVHFEIT